MKQEQIWEVFLQFEAPEYSEEGIQEFAVNSSPYAVEIYRHLGFEEVDQEQTVNGIRFTPMKYVEVIEMNKSID